MSKNLFDFANEELQKKVQEDKVKTENIEKDVQEKINKYKGYSENDLLQEFHRVTKEKKQEGSLDSKKILNVVDKLSPFLNNQQKESLKNLIKTIDD